MPDRWSTTRPWSNVCARDWSHCSATGKVVGNFPTVMGSEDFQEAFAPLNTPYVFLLIGVAPPELVAAAQKQGRLFPYSNHNPDFFVELPAVTLGAQINTVAALALLGSKP